MNLSSKEMVSLASSIVSLVLEVASANTPKIVLTSVIEVVSFKLIFTVVSFFMKKFISCFNPTAEISPAWSVLIEIVSK